MQLDGVIALGEAPVAYVRRVNAFEERREAHLHQRHWLSSTAPLLLVVDDESLRAYSNRPRSPGKQSGKAACIQVLDRVVNALEIQYLLEHVRTGSYFREHKRHFEYQNGVESLLLKQLRGTRNALKRVRPDVSLADCHSLLVRSLILRYLSDRHVLNEDFFTEYLESPAQDLHDYLRQHEGSSRLAIGRVFAELAKRLNIKEFDDARRFTESSRFKKGHFELVSRFLRDENVDGSQLTIGNWTFDFSLLPVELISAVYQQFIYDEVPDAKSRLGLVPTPRYLAEVVLNLAFENIPTETPRILDPACGSGIFLVGCFNRLAYEWRIRNSNASGARTYKALRSILRDSIVGVELKDTACELARINLLHALLNQLSGRRLRTIIERGNDGQIETLSATSVEARSFFASSSLVEEHSFDIVVGNPPWSNDPIADWQKKYPDRPCPKRGNLVYAFAWVAADYLRKGGQACLLLDGKAMLFSPPARQFVKKWYSSRKLDLIVNLAAFRSVLFRGAGRAAAIFRFSAGQPSPGDRVRYVTPWATSVTSHGGILDLSEAKSEPLRLAEIVRYAEKERLPSLLRPRLFGTSRDLSLIERLQGYGRLGDAWSVHQGFNRHGTNKPPINRPLLKKIPFLRTAGGDVWAGWLPLDRFTIPYAEEGKTTLIRQWPVDERVFLGPRVILHHTPMQTPPMFRAAAVTDDLTFHKEIFGIYQDIPVPTSNKLLAGILMSELAYYFFFHTSLSWGVEAKPQVRQGDVVAFPWLNRLTNDQKIIARQIVEEVTALEGTLGYAESVEHTRRRVSELALDYYELSEWERDLVRDCASTTASLAFSGGREPLTTRLAMASECSGYVEKLTSALQAWSPSNEPLGGMAFISTGAQMGVVLLRRGAQGPISEALEDDDELTRVLGRLKEIARKRYDWNSASSNLVVFDGDCLYITKPLGQRHWTRTAALNDADLIAASVLRPQN